jgi:hypothetical protein
MNLALLLGLAHGLSDAIAGALVMGALLSYPPAEAALLVLLYNGLAFGFQPVAGYLLDLLGKPRFAAPLGLALTAAGLSVWGLNFRLAMALVGFGSCLFHAGAGAQSLLLSPGRASAPGLFAGFGVIGQALGFLFWDKLPAAPLLVLVTGFAAALWFFPARSIPRPDFAPPAWNSLPWVTLSALLLAVGLRSYIWVGFSSSLPESDSLALGLALAAGAGKLSGGFFADRLGWRRYALVGLGLSGLALGAGLIQPFLLLPGVFLLQSLTPLSLAAVGKLLPQTPSLAAGLVLGTGVIIGGLPYMLQADGWFSPFLLFAVLLLAGLFYALGLRGKNQPVLEKE